MKKTIFLTIILLFIVNQSHLQPTEEHPIDKFYSECMNKTDGVTLNMLNCIDETHASWDKQMNKVYNEFMKKLNPENQKAFRESQRQWIKYRDLEFDFSVKLQTSIQGGTMHNVLFAERRMEFIKARALELELYLEVLKELE